MSRRLLHRALNACARPLLAGALVAAGLGTALADGTVYKWTDAQGHVHYSDLPPTDSAAQAVPVNTGYNHAHSPQPAHNAGPQANGATRPGGPVPGSATPATAPEKKVAADLAVAHADDCKKAKATYDNYIRVRHLYKQADGGDKTFLSDAEIEQARVDALKDMTDACGDGGQP